MSSAASYMLAGLQWANEQRIASVLARAFVDDPLVIAICAGSAAERERRMLWSFRIAVRGHCLATQPGWTLSGADMVPLAAVLMTRPRMQVDISADLLFTVRGLLHIGLGMGVRGFQAARIIAEHAPAEPFTYLRTLGVHPNMHGRGLGSRLVEQVIRAAPPALPVYLETAKERNLSFYLRHGFECIGKFHCLGVPVWRLLRPAAPVPATGQ